jgi:arylformamidase
MNKGLRGAVPYIDISLPIERDMLLYPGDAPPRLHKLLSLERGDALTSSELSIGCHVGTHVDAPAHFCRDGATVDQLGLEHFEGLAVVVEVQNVGRIEASDLNRAEIPLSHHVLLKTDNSRYLRSTQFNPHHCYVTPDAVDYILSCNPLSIGFDYYSLDPPSDSLFPAHTMVARRGIPVFVCLDLSKIQAGIYEFSAIPMPVIGAEGMPVRALLRKTGKNLD